MEKPYLHCTPALPSRTGAPPVLAARTVRPQSAQSAGRMERGCAGPDGVQVSAQDWPRDDNLGARPPDDH